MSQKEDQSAERRVQRAVNLTLAAVVGQVGCLTLVLILAALVVGLWLDVRFDSRPLFTIILMIGSVPVAILAMFWIVRKATTRMVNGPEKKTSPLKEDAERE